MMDDKITAAMMGDAKPSRRRPTMELIEREALIQAIEDLRGSCDSRFYDEAIIDCVSEAVSAPTIDAAPVVHGRWIQRYNENHQQFIECSNCNFEYGLPFACKLNYCPHCGARMDGTEERT